MLYLIYLLLLLTFLSTYVSIDQTYTYSSHTHMVTDHTHMPVYHTTIYSYWVSLIYTCGQHDGAHTLLSGSRLCTNGPLWLQGAAVFTFRLVMSLFLSYSTWPPYANVCIVITLKA